MIVFLCALFPVVLLLAFDGFMVLIAFLLFDDMAYAASPLSC